MTLKFIDLFGVPGGMSLGFKLTGMKPVGALDIFESGIETYKKNFTETPEENVVCADASKNNIVEKFRKQTSLKPGDVDVIVGGPPCQGFSNVGRIKIASLVKNGQRNGRSSDPRFIDDKRNHLYKSFIKFVDWFKPKAIVMENVLGMVSYKNGRIIEQIKEDFKNAGYPNVEYQVLNAIEYGVPQFRRRVFFIATKNNMKISWPEQTHFPKSDLDRKSLMSNARDYVTVGDALGDLPSLRLPEKNLKMKDSEKKYGKLPECEFQKLARGGKKTLRNNITRWHRDKDIEVFRNMSPGERWCDLSDRDRKKIGYSDKSFNDKWKRLSNNKPSWTVVSHLAKDGYMYIHPTQNRTISVREAARLQSFPDSFVFYGSRSAQFKQIGNAVPPLLAFAIAKHLKKMLADKYPMADIFTKEKRSWMMSRIHGKNTKIEITIGNILRSNRIKFVRHPKIYGNPDFLVGKKTAVFCDGDFWHGFQYEKKKKPAKKFWKDKIEKNMSRDKRISQKLRRDGYSVIRLWEHDIEKRPQMCLNRITHFMR